ADNDIKLVILGGRFNRVHDVLAKVGGHGQIMSRFFGLADGDGQGGGVFQAENGEVVVPVGVHRRAVALVTNRRSQQAVIQRFHAGRVLVQLLPLNMKLLDVLGDLLDDRVV